MPYPARLFHKTVKARVNEIIEARDYAAAEALLDHGLHMIALGSCDGSNWIAYDLRRMLLALNEETDSEGIGECPTDKR